MIENNRKYSKKLKGITNKTVNVYNTPIEHHPIYTRYKVLDDLGDATFLTWEITAEVAKIAQERALKYKEEKQKDMLRSIENFAIYSKNVDKTLNDIDNLRGKKANE